MFNDFCDCLFKSLLTNVFFKTILVYLVFDIIFELTPELIQ